MDLKFIALKEPPEQTNLRTNVFIDYESLYISFLKQYSVPPLLDVILDEIKTMGKVLKIKVFGDFTKPELSQERNRIRTITSDIIDCGSESSFNKKDFTDFIMLDHIYQDLIQSAGIEQYIFFTGDGHFSSAATFMRSFMDKIIGIYGVYGSLSRHLMDCSSWTKEISVIDDEDIVYQTNLLKCIKSAQDKGLTATFMKTVDLTVRQHGGEQQRYIDILRGLIDDKYLFTKTIEASDYSYNALVADWDRIESDFEIQTKTA